MAASLTPTRGGSASGPCWGAVTGGSERPAIVVLGKARGRRRESLQLLARTAVAAALWHAAVAPKPVVAVGARDAPGGVPDAQRVARRLAELGVPSERILARSWSNCTLLEARAVRVLARAHGLGGVTVVTHPYHRARAQRLFAEVLGDVEVRAVEPALVRALPPRACARDLEEQVAASMPGGLDLAREQVIEFVLGVLHRIDPRGRVERGLAPLVRPQI